MRKRPSIITISPPVLDPPMRSKYWHGRGSRSRLLIRCTSFMMVCTIKSVDKPLTPPPSHERILGVRGIKSMPWIRKGSGRKLLNSDVIWAIFAIRDLGSGMIPKRSIMSLVLIGLVFLLTFTVQPAAILNIVEAGELMGWVDLFGSKGNFSLFKWL